MDVFLMVRRKKTTIFLDAKETTTVLDLKKMIEGITKKAPADQQLFNKDDVVMDDEKNSAGVRTDFGRRKGTATSRSWLSFQKRRRKLGGAGEDSILEPTRATRCDETWSRHGISG